MYCIDNMTDKLNHRPQPELSEHDAELLSAYIDEMLSVDEQRELEARLLKDAFLRAELAAMRQTVIWMNALPTLKAPRNFTISAEDVAPAEKTPDRKVIPMQNRNSWYLASAAAIVIVIVGLAVILPSFNIAPASDGASESIAFSATQIVPQGGEAPLDAPDMADADNQAEDTALFEADREAGNDIAEESAEMDDSSPGLDDTANVQAVAVADTISMTNIAPAGVQITVSSRVEQIANFALQTATPLATAQGGGNGSSTGGADSPMPSSASMDVMAEAETTLEPGESDADLLNAGDVSLAAEAPVAPQDESQAPDFAADSGSSGASANSVDSGIEARSVEPEPSNLIQAVLQAMRDYVASKQP